MPQILSIGRGFRYEQRVGFSEAPRVSDNPVIRAMAVIAAVAVGIRLVYELLQPVALYLLIALVIFAAARLLSWYRGRW